MTNSYRQILPITPTGFAKSITALAFDPVSDILWTGCNTGTVTAYFGKEGIRGPSFPVGSTLGVTKIVADDNSLRAVGMQGEGFGSWTKGGMNKWYFRSNAMIETFSDTLSSSHILAASTHNMELIFLSTMTGSLIRKISSPSLITHLESTNSLLASGSVDGYIRTHDPRAGSGRPLAAEHTAKAHHSSVQGLQTSDNFIFTIGMGERLSRPFPDPLVKIFDLRTMRALTPIPFSSGPAFIQKMPNHPTRLAIVSSQGLINIVDASNPTSSGEFYQLDVASYLTSFAVSSDGGYMACGNAEGSVHLLSSVDDETPFNGFAGQALPWADRPAPLPEIEWTTETPLNSIGMPYFENQLLSAWPTHLGARTPHYSPPPKIPPQILASMKYKDGMSYSTVPPELRGRRNIAATPPRKDATRFHSEKSKDPESTPASATEDDVYGMYEQVEIKYSKFGVEDFDFGFHNKTQFSGLETHILNSYTNSVVQILHYIHPIRQLAKIHITINCLREHCLLCELGFVSRMLEDARGRNCQASNFCKTVGVLAQMSNALDLIDYGWDSSNTDYAQKIQTFHRFLVDHMNVESHAPPNPAIIPGAFGRSSFSPISQLLGLHAKNSLVCLSCGARREKTLTSHVIDLQYPAKVSKLDHQNFETILQNSLSQRVTHKALCHSCREITNLTSQRTIPSRALPPVLAINACVYNGDTAQIWQGNRGIRTIPTRAHLYGGAGDGINDDGVEYEVRAVAVKVVSRTGKSHLVAIVKVPDVDDSEGSGSPWYLFNDFVVKNISEEQALDFREKWKIPSIIYLERVDMHDSLNFSGFAHEIDKSFLMQDTSISKNRDPSLIRHRLLRPNELPDKGTMVAIDAEFVSMQQEETEFRSDGTKKTLRPPRLSLARVSVLRASGPHQDVPFIDDHIHTSEIIVDYLTEFSGIKYGDLDPAHSQYTLTPLKLVYKKLRLLVDCGCIFIGHGLSKDFRIINIYVPPDQVIDTVDLYFMKSRQRRLSLRFLSWYILGEHIQTDNHDSIEDARSALRLYHAYKSLQEQGLFEKKLEEIYREGRQWVSRFLGPLVTLTGVMNYSQNFKPPQSDEGMMMMDSRDSAMTISALGSRGTITDDAH
ncbi:ubiquitin carboxyl-terminal hydrolase-domain-containing protein [Panaeolus papilionaceus]|nr:ubiquitin carboxyl-terminal hydrolase-domain-containing protein [Panaeolus papilionaceus]